MRYMQTKIAVSKNSLHSCWLWARIDGMKINLCGSWGLSSSGAQGELMKFGTMC